MFSTSIGGYILIATIYMLNFTFVKPDCRSVLLSQCGVHEVNSVQSKSTYILNNYQAVDK